MPPRRHASTLLGELRMGSIALLGSKFSRERRDRRPGLSSDDMKAGRGASIGFVEFTATCNESRSFESRGCARWRCSGRRRQELSVARWQTAGEAGLLHTAKGNGQSVVSGGPQKRGAHCPLGPCGGGSTQQAHSGLQARPQKYYLNRFLFEIHQTLNHFRCF